MMLISSDAEKWFNCNLSPEFEANAKPIDRNNDAAREGICAAWLAEKMWVDPETDYLGVSHENGWLITEDMIYNIKAYLQLFEDRADVVLEKTMVVNGVKTRADAVSYSLDGQTLYVDELKYGYSHVDPYKNLQTTIAACGSFNDTVKYVQLGVFQPRGQHSDGPYKTWIVSSDKFIQWANTVIARSNAHHAGTLERIATPGRHCLQCKAINECGAAQQTMYHVFDVIRSSYHVNLTNAQIAAELKFLMDMERIFKARKDGLEAETMARLNNGEMMPGFIIEPKYSHRQWVIDPEVLYYMTGVDPFKKEVMTPAEYERNGVDKSIMRIVAKSKVIGKKLRTFNIEKAFDNG